MRNEKGQYIKGYTRKLSEEHKRKLSESHKGKKHSLEWKEKHILRMKGKKYTLGYKHTLESKEKISKNNARFFLGKKLTPEHLENLKKSQKYLLGEKSRRWIKDRSKLKTERRHSYDTQYKYWMLKVKNRDNWKCRIDNKECLGRIEAHHILPWRDYPKLRYDINNGITLCHFHHPRRNEEEKRLAPRFFELISLSE